MVQNGLPVLPVLPLGGGPQGGQERGGGSERPCFRSFRSFRLPVGHKAGDSKRPSAPSAPSDGAKAVSAVEAHIPYGGCAFDVPAARQVSSGVVAADGFPDALLLEDASLFAFPTADCAEALASAFYTALRATTASDLSAASTSIRSLASTASSSSLASTVSASSETSFPDCSSDADVLVASGEEEGDLEEELEEALWARVKQAMKVAKRAKWTQEDDEWFAAAKKAHKEAAATAAERMRRSMPLAGPWRS